MLLSLVLLLQAAAPIDPWQERLAFAAPEGTAISTYVFSPDGSRVGVQVHDGTSLQLYLDGEPVDKDGHDYWAGPIFSPDGAHVAWAFGDDKGRDKEKWEVHQDGKKVASHDWAGGLTMAEDGTLAYWAGKGVKKAESGWYEGGKYTLMVGKKKKGETRQIPPAGQVVLGPKGELLAHATLDQGYMLYTGKEEHGPYMWVSGITASANGRSLAWCVSAIPGMDDGDTALDPFAGGGMGLPSSRGEVYLDGELVSLPEDEAVTAPRLNRDGKRLAYIAQRNGKVTVVWRGKAWATTAGDASSPAISPDGKKVAVVFDHQVATASAGLTMLNTNWLDGGMEASFGPDGSIAMRVADGDCRVMIDDEQVAGPFKRAIAPVWSPDSKQVAVRVQEEEGWRVAVGGHLSELYEEVGPPRFDEQGTKVAFGARKGQELHWVLMELTGEE